MIEKPKKKEEVELCALNQSDGKGNMVCVGVYEKNDRDYDWGYNQACDEWEKYHEQFCKEIKSALQKPKDKRIFKMGDEIKYSEGYMDCHSEIWEAIHDLLERKEERWARKV